MATIAATLAPGLVFLMNPAQKVVAWLHSANQVDVNPTVAEVEQFFDLLTSQWNPPFNKVEALVAVVGAPVGAGYQGGFLRGGGALD
jgi:hypothetical protein